MYNPNIKQRPYVISLGPVLNSVRMPCLGPVLNSVRMPCLGPVLNSVRMPCPGPVFVMDTEQTNSCILKVHYNTYQTQRVHSICQFA